jgi:aspartate kinase
LILSCGEIIAGVLLTQALRAAGQPAVTLTGGQAGIITDRNFGGANIQTVKPTILRRHLEAGQIVVVAGFQGVTLEGEVTTLGRGGSDTTAVALGVALEAEVLEFYKDVDGIMTADPKLVPGARIIDVVSYNELFQMAYQGAKVVHPRAVELAMENNLPLRIKCTFNDSPGTRISYNGSPSHFGGEGRKIITGVTYIPNVAQIKVKTEIGNREQEMKIFQALATGDISIDLINVFPEMKIFTVRDQAAAAAADILGALGLEVTVIRGCAKVSIVGAGMRGVPGVMASFVAALDEAGVSILQTSDSHVTISGLVRQEDLEKSMVALHEKFGLGRS